MFLELLFINIVVSFFTIVKYIFFSHFLFVSKISIVNTFNNLHLQLWL